MNAFVTILVIGLLMLVVYLLARVPKYEESLSGETPVKQLGLIAVALLIGIMIGSIPAVYDFVGRLYKSISDSAPATAPATVPAAPAAPQGAAPGAVQQPQPAAPLPDITGVRWHKEDKRAVSFSDPPQDARWVIIHKRSQVPQGEFVLANEFRVPADQPELQDVKVYLQYRNGSVSQAVVLQPEDAPAPVAP